MGTPTDTMGRSMGTPTDTMGSQKQTARKPGRAPGDHAARYGRGRAGGLCAEPAPAVGPMDTERPKGRFKGRPPGGGVQGLRAALEASCEMPAPTYPRPSQRIRCLFAKCGLFHSPGIGSPGPAPRESPSPRRQGRILRSAGHRGSPCFNACGSSPETCPNVRGDFGLTPEKLVSHLGSARSSRSLFGREPGARVHAPDGSGRTRDLGAPVSPVKATTA
jgi:hypothetical protein